MIWAATAVVSSIGAGLLLFREHYVAEPAVEVLISVLAGSVAFGACIYCLAVFALQRRVRSLLAATAFSTLASGTLFQTIVDLRGSPPCVFGWVTTVAWAVAGLLFVGEAYSKAKWRAANRAQSIAQLAVAAAAVLAFPLTVLPYVSDYTLLSSFSSSPGGASLCRVVDAALCASAAGLVCWTLVANYRRYTASADGLSGLACYFYVAAVLGLVFCCVSAERFDIWYTIGEALFVWSWLALIVGNGVENAFAHQEAGERLDELETLHDVSWSLVGARTVRELLDLFVTTLVSKLGTRIAAVYLSQDEQTLELAAIRGSDDVCLGTKYSLVSSGPWPGFHSGHTAKAFASREVQVANDVFVDVEFVSWRIVAGDDGCAASIPLIDRDACIGVLNVYFCDSSQLTSARLRLLATIAAAATSAIEYAVSKEASPEADTELDFAA